MQVLQRTKLAKPAIGEPGTFVRVYVGSELVADLPVPEDRVMIVDEVVIFSGMEDGRRTIGAYVIEAERNQR